MPDLLLLLLLLFKNFIEIIFIPSSTLKDCFISIPSVIFPTLVAASSLII